ncbi:uncharacterized protein LOC128134264 [Lactuca sativa]|uniref:uncharacterized protein LOC128134264 n=1 Tax=Lactuca sativa TaxID=4236 RepID=UPI0022AEF8FB|nr:uncharacterized protein LOC128134264 [Lactuca sativa]
MINGRASSKDEVGDKRKFDGFPRSNKRSKFGSRIFEGEGEGGKAKWCEKCRKKHFGKYSEELTCYKCGMIGHYTNECTSNKRVCYGCNEDGHISKDCPNKKEALRPNVPPKPKARAFHMILDEEGANAIDRE